MKEYLPYFLALITALIGWVAGQRKEKAVTAKTEIEVVERAIEIWRTLATDLKKEVDELRIIVNELREENQKFKYEISSLKNTR